SATLPSFSLLPGQITALPPRRKGPAGAQRSVKKGELRGAAQRIDALPFSHFPALPLSFPSALCCALCVESLFVYAIATASPTRKCSYSLRHGLPHTAHNSPVLGDMMHAPELSTSYPSCTWAQTERPSPSW